MGQLKILGLTEEELRNRVLSEIDIAFDEFSNLKSYKPEEDPKFSQSKKTNRGLLSENWRKTEKPIMCCYKVVNVSFEVWGFQTRVEDFIHRSIRDTLLLGHRQAFAWIDEWLDMTIDDVRSFEKEKMDEMNEKFKLASNLDVENKTSLVNSGDE